MLTQIRFKFAKRFPKTIHCETFYRDEVWKELKKYLIKYKNIKVFCMSPYNFQYFHNLLYPGMSIGLLNKVMSSRVKEMIAMGCDIQLHVHLSQFGQLGEDEERNLVEFGKNWLESLGAHPTIIQFGWYQENERLALLCGELGLKIYPRQRWHNIHDFALVNPDDFHIQQEQKGKSDIKSLGNSDNQENDGSEQTPITSANQSKGCHTPADSSSLNLREVNTDGRKEEESSKEKEASDQA